MQNYAYIGREFTPQTPQSIILLHPEQIVTRAPAKNHAQSKNTIIRLAASIQKYGILEPIEVTCAQNRGNFTEYTLIDGERRLRAAILCGIDRVPCHILPEGHRKCALQAILLQLKQESLHFFEQAATLHMLIQDFSLTQEEIARKSGFSQSAIANKLRLLAFSREEQGQISSAGLTERHARALLRIKTPEARKEAFLRARDAHLSVAATEQLVESLLNAASHVTQEGIATDKPLIFPETAAETSPKPRKFALQSLTPLYNSIERSLSIFRKTGAQATMERQLLADGVRITIDIPAIAPRFAGK